MVGVLVPEAEVVLVAPSFARLTRLDLALGDHVDAGGLIAEMDVRGDLGELRSATAAWRASAAEHERLSLELEAARASRVDVEKLQDYVAQAEVREQRYAEKLAKARRRGAEASLLQQRSKMEDASARIAEAELRAPFAGVIALRHVDAGSTLAAGDPVIRMISDARLVRFAIPESRSRDLRVGTHVQVRFPGTPAVPAVIVTIAPEIEVGTRLIFAEARLLVDTVATRVLRVGTISEVTFDPTPMGGPQIDSPSSAQNAAANDSSPPS